jgi:hypothetical protein
MWICFQLASSIDLDEVMLKSDLKTSKVGQLKTKKDYLK